MDDKLFYGAAVLDADGKPLVVMLIPSKPGEPHFELAVGPISARQMAVALLEQADAAEKLAVVRPEGLAN